MKSPLFAISWSVLLLTIGYMFSACARDVQIDSYRESRDHSINSATLLQSSTSPSPQRGSPISSPPFNNI